jgi:hypothetical protein
MPAQPFAEDRAAHRPRSALARRPAHGDTASRAIAACGLFVTTCFATLLTWRIRPLVRRFFYPSVLAVRLGRGKGIDGLIHAILDEQFSVETGAPMPADLPLTDLAAARANMLPRALTRPAVRLLFEQHVIGPLHVLLARGNYQVEAWVRDHHRDVFGAVRAWSLSRVLRRHVQRRDPVAALRLRPESFSALVWRTLWALAELEGILATSVPSADTRSADTDDADPVRSAVDVAMRLDTDHSEWAEPERFLRDLHRAIRAATSLAPSQAMVRHVARRVHHAVLRLPDFAEAYDVATAQDPPPDWIGQALEAIDSEHEYRGTDSAAKLVRRIACRIWVNGSLPVPSRGSPPTPVAPVSTPATSRQVSSAIDDDDDDETGF